MKKNLLTVAIASSLFATSVYASEQPKAEDLVGKIYGGIHASMMSADDRRLPTTSFEDDDSQGLGLEVGYRWTKEIEFRLAYTDLTLDVTNTSEEVDGDALALDALYFPTAQNFYVLGGLNALDIVNTQTSVNLGLGYRHFFSDRFAAYAEAKTHFQLDKNFDDYTAQIGLAYFFGETSKAVAPKQEAPKAVKKAEPTPVAKTAPAAPVDGDDDKDGVLNSVDKCPTTPMNDKVDAKGCTIFTEEVLTQRLLVNFDNNKAIVKPEYFAEIEKVAKFMKKYPETKMTIEGHTSSQGSDAYNLTLSDKRAAAIVDVLVTKFGISQSRLSAKGYGETRLLNPANTAQAHKENRRIEAVVQTTEKVKVQR